MASLEPPTVSSVLKEREFLEFLLVSNLRQATLLLRNITPSQTDCISEIFQNILHGEDLDPALLEGLKRHKVLIRSIGDDSQGLTASRSAIVRHPPAVLKILRLVESILPLKDD